MFKMLTSYVLTVRVIAVFRPLWTEVAGFDFFGAEHVAIQSFCKCFRRSQKVGVRDVRFPLAPADPPPPHSLCITGLDAHNRWLSLLCSPQSRPGQVLRYLPERERGRGRVRGRGGVGVGKLGADVEFHTPRRWD